MQTDPVWKYLAGAASLAIAIGLGVPALAQETAPDGSTAIPDDEVQIVVTGTRLKVPDYSYPNPVVALTSEDIEKSGSANITDFLVTQPALVGSSTRGTLAGAGADTFIGSTGLNLLNLRNFGIERTLVLVNGRRHVASLQGTAAVDINTIPEDLIERVDVLTGGQSAIYGADGVTGVVNFIMKRDFEGLKLRGQIGTSGHGDAGQKSFAITAGKNFADDRGNFAVSYEFAKEDRLVACDRKYLCGNARRSFQDNPGDPNDDPTRLDKLLLNNIRFFDSAREGGIDLDFDGMPDILPDGTKFRPGRYIPPFYQQGGSGTRRSDYIGDLFPSVKRHIVNALFNYEFSEKAKLFIEGKYARTNSYSVDQPSYDFYNYLSVDNPFMPAAVRSQVIPGVAGSDDFGFGDPSLPDGILMNRDNFDFGTRGERIKRETWRGVIGLEGEINDHANYSVSYNYGQTKVRTRFTNNQITDRFYAAMDVVTGPDGNPVCRVTLEGAGYVPYPTFNYTREPKKPITFSPSECVPLNVFGEGSPSQEALDFITARTVDRNKLTQQVASAYVTGDFGEYFELPGGPVQFVLGGEYRKEKSRFVPDPLAAQGLTFTNATSIEDGSFSVKEAYAELRLPILADRNFFQEFSVGSAIRFSDYSTIGKTTTWKVDGLWNTGKSVTFRGTYSQAIRAPNIGELFGAAGETFEFIEDPCDRSNLNNGTTFRADNCRALLTSLGVDPADFVDLNSSSIAGILSGNRNLQEEKAKTWTAGIVFQPTFAPTFRLSLDWYNIKLTNAIRTADPEDVAELCVDSPTLDNQYCDRITRTPGTGRIVKFVSQPLNVAVYETAGLDVNLSYLLRTDRAGEFSFRLVGNYLDKLDFTPDAGAEIQTERNEIRSPKYQATFDLAWTKGPFTVNYGFNYFGPTFRYDYLERRSNPDIVAPRYKKYPAKHTQDIYLSYLHDDRFKVFAGINNFTNQKPAVGSTYYPVDATGRFFFAGVEVTLEDLFR